MFEDQRDEIIGLDCDKSYFYLILSKIDLYRT